MLGSLAQHHPAYGQIHYLAETLAEFIGASFGVLSEAGNSVGAQAAGAIPGRGPLGKEVGLTGLNARAMLEQPRKAYLLLGAEPELDCNDGAPSMRAMAAAEFVVALSAYRHKALDYADVMLPIAPFTETAGTFINMEGRVQRFHAVVKPHGEARPAWKVLRVLGNLLGLEGFDQDTAESVAREVLEDDPQAVSQCRAEQYGCRRCAKSDCSKPPNCSASAKCHFISPTPSCGAQARCNAPANPRCRLPIWRAN